MDSTGQIEPTIAAIATPPGQGGIGIVRLSGSLALPILQSIFRKSSPPPPISSHRFYHGWIIRPSNNEPVDEVLAVFMQAPRSYTREDVVEIHCHGGPLILTEILSLVLNAGAVPATPGEFTKRAFLNGRIDLTKAEAVAEMLGAKTRQGLKLAVDQLHGGLLAQITKIRETLLDIRALLEVAIDFPEDEEDIINSRDFKIRISQGAIEPLQILVRSADQGKIFRDGISVVILGRPNVGKSSLLNALLREERAIVASSPGTTRDTIEEYIDVKGIPVRLVDTAGIRKTPEAVEEIGIERARRKQEEADLVLLLFDLTSPLSSEDEELYGSIKNKPLILVANKIDLRPDYQKEISRLKMTFKNHIVVPLSAQTLAGLDELETAIYNTVTGSSSPEAEPSHNAVPNLRHKAEMEKALGILEEVMQGLNSSVAPDLLTIDIQETLECLGDIIGEATTEDILDRIFSKFCIGK